MAGEKAVFIEGSLIKHLQQRSRCLIDRDVLGFQLRANKFLHIIPAICIQP